MLDTNLYLFLIRVSYKRDTFQDNKKLCLHTHTHTYARIPVSDNKPTYFSQISQEGFFRKSQKKKDFSEKEGIPIMIFTTVDFTFGYYISMYDI